MLKYAVIFMLSALMALSLAGTGVAAQTTGFPLRITDQAGHPVMIKQKPVRIASTTEGTDEILAALVPKKSIALVTMFSSDPSYSNIVKFVKGIPAIQTDNAEQILAVRPDLVLLASYDTPGVVSQVEQAGVPAYEFANFNSIADIEKNILIIGHLTGTENKAQTLVGNMQQQLKVLAKRAKGHPRLRVLDYSSYGFAAGSDTTVNDIIRAAGAINAASALRGWQKITDEEVVKLNPDVIIDASDDAAFLHSLAKNPALQTVKAVRNHRLYAINSADLSSVSQYVVSGVTALETALYPRHS